MPLTEIREIFGKDNFSSLLGINIDSAESGHAVVSVEIEKKHINGNNVVQGGVVFTLADFSCAVAANADEMSYVTADGNISYYAPAVCKKLIAEARVLKHGKTLAFCETTIKDETGKIIAKANFTMCRNKQ